jgi:hypothetical protein
MQAQTYHAQPSGGTMQRLFLIVATASTVSSMFYTFPLRSTISKSPSTFNEPLLLTVNFTFSMLVILRRDAKGRMIPGMMVR